MTLKKQLAGNERLIDNWTNEIAGLKEEVRELKEELDHYRTAVSAVKWLWDQAIKISEKRPFQL